MSKRVFTQTFGVVGAIIERDGKVLLVKEGAHTKTDVGKWNQPAGWIDVGENPAEAVSREVKEETGFDFELTGMLGVYSLLRKDRTDARGTPHAIKIIFVGKIGERQTELAGDTIGVKWFAPEEIYAMDLQTLRDLDIKKEVKDYFAGKRYPL